MGFSNFPIASLNLWLYSHADSLSLYLISHNSERACCSDCGKTKFTINLMFYLSKSEILSLIIPLAQWISCTTLKLNLSRWSETQPILFASRVPRDLQMASQRNQCCSTSSSPLPQNSGYRVRDPAC
jgi:hypothetical protein